MPRVKLKDDKVADAILSRLSVGISSTIDSLFTKFEVSFTERMERMVERMTGDLVKKACDEQDRRITALENENKLLKQQTSEFDVVMRMDNLVIHGVPEEFTFTATDGESSSRPTHDQLQQQAIESVMNLCQSRLNLPINESDISLAYRIQRIGKDATRPIFVRFVNRNMRNKVLAAKKLLKEQRHSGLPRIYINEHLTRNNSIIYAKARSMVKEKKLLSTWTNNGYIYTRCSDSPSEKPKKILQIEDLT